jgi:hypothetical protein
VGDPRLDQPKKSAQDRADRTKDRAMSIFVVEINGIGVVAFNADSLFRAERIAAAPRMRSDLMVHETVAGPIWNGADEVIVRQAVSNERSLWERTLAFAVSETISEELGTLEVWLVKITNQTDDATRQRPLH